MIRLLLDIEPTNYWVNNWHYVAGVVISLVGVAVAIKGQSKKNSKDDAERTLIKPRFEANNESNISSVISPVNNVQVIVGQKEYSDNHSEISQVENVVDRNLIIERLKSKVSILFIDDDKKFNIVKILKDSQWRNTNTVVDIKSVDLQIIKDADIIFVDINGVGKLLQCEHEGLDIALMLKQKYPNKKIVIYSANKYNDNFHPAWDACDFKLEKNALSYQFLSLVEQYSIELYSQNL